MLNLSNAGLGDAQLTALLDDRALLGTIKHWKLRDARLSGAGFHALAEALPDCTETLDLSRNNIDGLCAGALARLLASDRLASLRRLNLSSCGLRFDALGSLLSELGRCRSLFSVELNNNGIQEASALGSFVANHRQVMQLSLHGNYLSGAGCAQLFKGVLKNARRGGQLASIDIAWNGAGRAGGEMAAKAIASVLRESATLYHLDLSYNGMDAACCAAIAEGLRSNHLLFGLHMVGNAATMDAEGFLLPLDNTGLHQEMQPGQLAVQFGELLKPHNMVGGSRGVTSTLTGGGQPHVPLGKGLGGRAVDDGLRERDVLEQRTSCWACEGWVRVDIQWPIDPASSAPRAVWAFTSLDGFRKGLRLRRLGQEQRFSAAKMVPPGYRLLAIFQVDSALLLPPGIRAEPLAEPADIELLASEELPILAPPPGQQVVQHLKERTRSGDVEHRIVLRSSVACALGTGEGAQVPLQVGDVGRRIVVLDGADGCPVTMPRVTEAEYRMRSTPTPPRRMPFHEGFAREDAALLSQCLAADWSHAKVSRLVPETEKKAVLEVLEKHYGKILAIYKHLSALDISGQAGFGVSQIQACNLMMSAGLVDDAVTKISDIDRLFINSNVLPLDLPKDFLVGNDKSLVRFQFLEFLLRVARQHFVEGRAEVSLAEAVERTLAALEPAGAARVSEMDAYFEALHTEEVDDIFKRHASMLREVYRHSSSRSSQAGRPAFMPLAGFQELLAAASMYDGVFQQRKGAVAFRMGMLSRPDEVHNTRFKEMSFLEFQHAVGAVAYLRCSCEPSRLAPELAQLLSVNVSEVWRKVRRAKASKKLVS